MKILVFDPSGNYFEGKGTTGWAMYYNKELTSVGQILAEEYESRHEYWKAHISLIKAIAPDYVVIEDYRLYPSRAAAQSGSELETPQLIGLMKYILEEQKIPFFMQHAKIKNRFTNKILLHKNIITQNNPKGRFYAAGVPLSGHIIDAIRHGEFFITFKLNILERIKE